MSFFTKLHPYMIDVEDHSHSTVNDRKKMPPNMSNFLGAV